MITFAVHLYKSWQRDYARFERELSQRRLQILDCSEGTEEALISVVTGTREEADTVSELARIYFGKFYAGLLQ